MNLSSIASIASMAGAAPSSAVSSKQASGARDADGDNDGSRGQVQLSPRAKLMSQLQALEQSDPTKAKAVLQQIAKTLKADAGSATGSSADRLNQAAAKFQAAADSGDLSALSPSQTATAGAAHHHGHHHAKAAQAYAATSDAGQQITQAIEQALAA